MNRACGMRCKSLLISVVILSLAACHPQPAAPNPESDVSPPPTVQSSQYVISGGVAHPGPRTLQPGDTVSSVLARDFPNDTGRPCTIVLIRQAPEGKTRQLIQLDAAGKLVNPKLDLALRNGDELLFPGGDGSNSMRNPTGPPTRAPE
jgi:hypothetical protein